MQWQVDGEGRTAPPTADRRSATTLVRSAMETTPPAPRSPGFGLAQGESTLNECKSPKRERERKKESIAFMGLFRLLGCI